MRPQTTSPRSWAGRATHLPAIIPSWSADTIIRLPAIGRRLAAGKARSLPAQCKTFRKGLAAAVAPEGAQAAPGVKA